MHSYYLSFDCVLEMTNYGTTLPNTTREKFQKFNRSDFKRSQQIFFYLITLSLLKFLKEDPPSYTKEKSYVEKSAVVVVDVWKYLNFLCRNYVLNRLDNTL